MEMYNPDIFEISYKRAYLQAHTFSKVILSFELHH